MNRDDIRDLYPEEQTYNKENKMSNKMTRAEVYNLVDGEREYQNNLWPSHETPQQELTIGEFVLMLHKYVSLAEAEWVVEKKPEMNTMNIIRKIGGIAVRAMEIHGAPARN